MKQYAMPATSLPIAKEVDVLVIGAGPAGFSAAVCAAREGMNTLLIEQSGDVGGVATIGLMSHWTGHTQGGFYEELLDRSCEGSGGTDHAFNGNTRHLINPERLKTVMLDMLQEAGASLRLYTFACEALVEEGRIVGVVVQSKSGREVILAKVVIDASGDGDIAASAGAPFYKGREEDGKMQPMTIMFKIAGVNTDQAPFPGGFEDTADVPKGEIQQLARATLESPLGHVLIYRTTLPGVVTINMTNCTDVDGTNVDDLTKATHCCRQQMDKVLAFLKDCAPGFEKAYIISSASFIGVRETRHFIGDATITKEDIEEARIFDDWAVTKAHFNFDVHNLTGAGLDETGAQRGFTQTKGYTIPYGCFVPKQIEGLLLAGRNICGTHMAHSNYRVMPICANMGQSVAVAAALSIKQGVLPRQLAVTDLQTRLQELGVCP